MDTTVHSIDEFVDLHELLPHVRESGLPSEHSTRWYVRRHRQELVEGGALIVIAGRLRFHPKRFKELAVEIGREQAKVKTS